MKIILIPSLIFISYISLISCEKSSSPPAPQMENIKLSDISDGNCLNLEKLSNYTQMAEFNFPAAMLTTDFKILSESNNKKSVFLNYASFFYKQAPINQMGLFTAISQKECKEIIIKTASQELLTYKITEHSGQHLQFSLTEQYADDMPSYKKDSLKERLQPTEYTIVFLPDSSLKMTIKYKTIDPLCDGKNPTTAEITKKVFWRQSYAELPQSYEINSTYFNAVKQALASAPTPDPSDPPITSMELETPTDYEMVDINEIRRISGQPLASEWKMCH